MSPRQSNSTPAFTLVELLVSMTVLTLLVVCVVGMVNGVSQSTTANRRHLEADEEARRVFDRMGYDFAKMFKRADADSLFVSIKQGDPNSGENDKMFFYSESPTYFAPGTLTASATTDGRGTAGLIGYRVPNGTAANRWQLERLGMGLTWDGPTSSPAPGGVVFLTYAAPTPAPPATPTPLPASTLAGNWSTTIGTAPKYDDGVDKANYHVLSDYVFRLEYCFALKNPTGTMQFSTQHDQSKGFGDVAAIVVAIAILDPQGRQQVPGLVAGQTPDLSKLAAALPDPDFTANPGVLMAQIWNTKLRTGSFARDAVIPQPVASQVRVYQRYFYLNSTQ